MDTLDVGKIGDFATLTLKEDFIKQLLDAPEQALASVGVEPTEELLQAIRDIEPDRLSQLSLEYLMQVPVPLGFP